MENKLSCEIVRDLLPSYAENLTGDVTNHAVMQHLDTCGSCREALLRMKEPKEATQAEAPQVDYMKKVRSRWRSRSLIALVLAVMMGFGAYFIQRYCIGYEGTPEEVWVSLQVYGDNVHVGAQHYNDAMAVRKVTLEEQDGIIKIKAYCVSKSDLSTEDNFAFGTFVDGVKQVWFGDRIIWAGDRTVRTLTSELFAARKQSLADVQDNGRIPQILGIGEALGSFSSEHSNSAKPNTWAIRLLEDFTEAELEQAEKKMGQFSCTMLASVKNLNTVSWIYTVDGTESTRTVTITEANEIAGMEVKPCYTDPEEMDELICRLFPLGPW